MACCIISDRPNISIHALLTESDLFYCFFALCYVISIHALLTESDHNVYRDFGASRPNFYPRSPYGERPIVPVELTTLVNISIHALLTESDHCRSL